MSGWRSGIAFARRPRALSANGGRFLGGLWLA
jgi:hypothetical protein